MPNWCSNFISIKGNEDEIDKFMKFAIGINPPYGGEKNLEGFMEDSNEKFVGDNITFFCFNNFVPVPNKVLENGYSSNGGEFGSTECGYGWQAEYWGTKWALYADDVEVKKENKCNVTYNFPTAWSPPVPVIEAASEMFPSLHFFMNSEEPGCGIYFDIKYKFGSVSSYRPYSVLYCEDCGNNMKELNENSDSVLLKEIECEECGHIGDYSGIEIT